MPKVTSKDGTIIAYDKKGQGPVLILVQGAMSKKNRGKVFADLLADRFTFVSYDRRGRGDSTDTLPYSTSKEVEDLDALIDELGGRAALVGHSSGCILALLATAKLKDKVTGLALYEAPYNDDPQALKDFRSYKTDLLKFIQDDKRDEAVGCFMKLVGVSEKQIAAMHKLPMWKGLTAMAPTLAYDTVRLMEEYPKIDTDSINTKALVMYGTRSYPFMADTATKLAGKIPNATLKPLEGQTHDVKASVLAPVLADFLVSTLSILPSTR